MQESELSRTARSLTLPKARVLEGVVSFVTRHHDWIIPSIHTEYLHNAKVENIRSAMIALADDRMVIKVIARHMPEALRLRPPSWLDLSLSSLTPSGESSPREPLRDKMNPHSHFIPSPTYLESAYSEEYKAIPDIRWLIEESSRIWIELQREDLRALVKTNVPTETAATIEALTSALLETLRRRPDMRAERVRGAVVSVMKVGGFSGALDEPQKKEVLRRALRSLNQQIGVEVQERFSTLNRSGWRF